MNPQTSSLVTRASRQTLYQSLTAAIIERLDKGEIPWRKPWTIADLPRNFATGRAYRGVNVFLLLRRFESPQWLTAKQALKLGGSIRRGEKASVVGYWINSRIEVPWFLKTWEVFNVRQTEGIDYAEPEKRAFNDLDRAEKIVEGYQNLPRICHGSFRAAYSPRLDRVEMPAKNDFRDEPSYYATLFHELVHSTGHAKRLARKGVTKRARFGDRRYSKEELIAEFGASFLCGHCSIERETLENSAAYIQHWRKVLLDDPGILVQSAGAAQRAADYILNVTSEKAKPSRAVRRGDASVDRPKSTLQRSPVKMVVI